MRALLQSLVDLLPALWDRLASAPILTTLVKLYSPDHLLAALIGMGVGVGLGWWGRRGMEHRRQRRRDRHTLILQWRQMVADVLAQYEALRHADPDAFHHLRSPLATLFERHPDFASLKRHLARAILQELYTPKTFVPRSAIPRSVSDIREAIRRLEKAWGLS